MTRFAVIIPDNTVVGVIASMEQAPFWTPPYQAYDADGNPVGDPQLTVPVPDTDPPTAQIGYSYNPGDGTFTAIPEVPPSSPSFISRVLSALNPFSSSK